MASVNFNIDLLQNHNITPAEGEQTVRTFCCTTYSSAFMGIQTNGYLGVTNKRVIYQAVGSQGADRSVLQSELPIADISGMSSFKGIYFSFIAFIGALFLTLISSAVVTSLLGSLAFILESYEAIQVISWIVVFLGFLGSFLVNVKSIGRPILVGVASAGLVALAGSSLFNFLGGASSWQLLLAGLMMIYAAFCCFWYARRPTFSLEIFSKGGANAAISIASASGLLTISATKSVNPKPARDADQMLKQLGAVIMDIQMLGDYGIEKWKNQ
jgi:hypothetical protein